MTRFSAGADSQREAVGGSGGVVTHTALCGFFNKKINKEAAEMNVRGGLVV